MAYGLTLHAWGRQRWKDSSGTAKQARKSAGRDISRLIILELEQRGMKLVLGWWIDGLIVFFFFYHLSFYSSNHVCVNALVNTRNIYLGP